MAQAGEVIEPIGIHNRVNLRQFVTALMMIDDDDRHSQSARFGHRLAAGAAAIYRHEQRSSIAREHTDGLDVWSVTLEDAVWNMNQWIEPAMAQVPAQQ